MTLAARAYPLRAATVIVGLSALVAVGSVASLGRFFGDLPLLATIAACLVYLFSHVLRAMRLGLLSIDLLGVSGRTASLMHLATAPLTLVLPFKSGELLRWHQLWQLSGSAIYALIVLLIDRMFDSLFLVPMLCLLVMMETAPPALVVLTLFVAIVPLVVLVVGPKLLTETQRYVVINHNNPGTLLVLRKVDALRLLVVRAALVARNRAPELGVLSFLIWLCEFAACLIIIVALHGASAGIGGSALELLGIRLVAPVWGLEAGTAAGAAIATSSIALLLPWPVLVMLYLRRRKHEPRRAPAGWSSENGLAQ